MTGSQKWGRKLPPTPLSDRLSLPPCCLPAFAPGQEWQSLHLNQAWRHTMVPRARNDKGYFPGHTFIFTEAAATQPQGHEGFWTVGTVPAAAQDCLGRPMPFSVLPIIKEKTKNHTPYTATPIPTPSLPFQYQPIELCIFPATETGHNPDFTENLHAAKKVGALEGRGLFQNFPHALPHPSACAVFNST